MESQRLAFEETKTFDNPMNAEKFAESQIKLRYSHQNGTLFEGDSIVWLKLLKDSSVDLVFADPPYNLNKEEWDNFESQEAYISWSLEWIKEVSRILTPNGSMYVCGFSEILADIKHPASKFFKSCRWLVWHYKNKANLGKDWGRSHESIIHFRKSKKAELEIDSIRIPYGNHTLKYPSHPQAETSNYGKGKKYDAWFPNPLGAKPKDVIDIPTTCNGMNEKTPHPTQKPEELVRKIVLASSKIGDVVLDPFSGSGTTVVVAEQLQRRWLGCEQNTEYNSWAIERLESIKPMPIEKWIEFDRKTLEQREKIR
jgi:site-specific DNA-methyltransferase (adenine-specific)